MGSNGRSAIALLIAPLGVLVLSGCAVIDADVGRHVEREEHRFQTTGTPSVSMATFDGSIEVRSWDRQEVLVVVERRALDKAAAASIQVDIVQNGNHIEAEVRRPSIGKLFGFNGMKSARLIVSAPASADISARSGDGSIDVEGVTGSLELRTGDGSIRGHNLSGQVRAYTGDGSIVLEGVSGNLDVETGDGSVRSSGTFSGVRVRTGDGSVRLSADRGSDTKGDWDIVTGDGSVTFEIPDDFNGELDAHTGDGHVRLIGITLSGVTGTQDKNHLRGSLGKGGLPVRIRTGDGSISLRRP